MYISYGEYLAMGGSFDEISEIAFFRTEKKAETIANEFTQGRLNGMELSDDLKLMMVEIVDKLYSVKAEDSGNVRNVSNDGYSVSYADSETVRKQLRKDCFDIVARYAPEYCFRGVR